VVVGLAMMELKGSYGNLRRGSGRGRPFRRWPLLIRSFERRRYDNVDGGVKDNGRSMAEMVC